MESRRRCNEPFDQMVDQDAGVAALVHVISTVVWFAVYGADFDHRNGSV